jgi:LmbE family N-acetylglucosaminyl deacetylase
VAGESFRAGACLKPAAFCGNAKSMGVVTQAFEGNPDGSRKNLRSRRIGELVDAQNIMGSRRRPKRHIGGLRGSRGGKDAKSRGNALNPNRWMSGPCRLKRKGPAENWQNDQRANATKPEHNQQPLSTF